jgi:biotin carboxyl carrier protein
MTTFEVEINGRGRTVSVERTAPRRFLVRVAGRQHDVEAVRIGAYGLSLLTDGGVSREIQVVPTSARGELLVGIEGRTVAAAIDGRRRGRQGVDGGASAPGEQKIVAPMPGRVVRVLVAAGDEVAAKQAVVVVEAMKMENELRSPKAGRVRAVSVTPGTSVEAGRVLIVIE